MRWLRAVAVTTLLAAACGGGGTVTDTTSGSTSTDPPGTTMALPDTTASPSSTTSTFPADDVVRVAVLLSQGNLTVTVGGEPLEGRVMARLGGEVSIELITDVPEELHVHGYDVLVAAGPGQPTMTTFVADIPGIFEVEQHFAGHVVVFSIQVQ